MTWKSYTAVSGATLLAGWFASSTPVPESAPGTASTARPAATAASASIVHEADRLQARVSRLPASPAPSRDPFRFGIRREAAAAGRDTAALEASPAVVEPPRPAPPNVSLSGIAEDTVDGQPLRTAVLSTPSDVLLVREGQEIPGRYRVAAIESDAVELVSLDDGRVVRLGLR